MENRETSANFFPEYAGFKQHDKVEGVTHDGTVVGGELKMFKGDTSTGKVEAIIILDSGQGDVNVKIDTLKLKMRAGKIFKAGTIEKH